jgi:very-short-patch-repair endonuclease
MSVSDLEELFIYQLKQSGLPRPDTREFKFHPTRRWRADFLYSEPINLCVEIEGGEWVNGRHNRNLAKDAEKYNEMELMGYRLLRFTGSMLKNGMAMEQMRRALT